MSNLLNFRHNDIQILIHILICYEYESGNYHTHIYSESNQCLTLSEYIDILQEQLIYDLRCVDVENISYVDIAEQLVNKNRIYYDYEFDKFYTDYKLVHEDKDLLRDRVIQSLESIIRKFISVRMMSKEIGSELMSKQLDPDDMTIIFIILQDAFVANTEVIERKMKNNGGRKDENY